MFFEIRQQWAETKMVVDVAMGVWVVLFPFVAHRHANADENQENYQVEHHNVQKAPIVDISGNLIGRKEIESDLLDHVDDIDYLISLTSKLNIGLLRKLMTFQA